MSVLVDDGDDGLRRRVRGWSALGTYLRTLALLLLIFAWAPAWIVLGGQRSLVGFLGQLQFSGLLVFATAPLAAVPIAWHLSRPVGPFGLPALFVLLKMTLVAVAAVTFYLVNSGAQPGAFSSRTAVGPRTLAFLMVGLPLSVPYGIVYGLAFGALLRLWAGRAADARG